MTAGSPAHARFRPRRQPLALVLAALSLAGCEQTGLSPGRNRPYALPLNNPAVVAAADASHMRPDDLVVGVVIRGHSRAYPWWILRNYHIANDTIPVEPDPLPDAGDDHDRYVRRLEPRGLPGQAYVPLLVTLCEACSGASAFVPTADGSVERPLVFAQCKRPRRWTGDYEAAGSYTMCDLQTQSRWHPFTGRAGSGRLRGARLARVPVAIDSWEAWRGLHPDTVVVLGGAELRARVHATLPGGAIGHESVHPSFERLLARHPEREDARLARNELVLGVAAAGGAARAYPLAFLRGRGGFVQDEVAGEPYVLLLRGAYRAAAYSRRLDAEILRFRVASEDPFRLQDESGTVWDERGRALTGTYAGRTLAIAADSYMAEWADWIMEHPGSAIAAD